MSIQSLIIDCDPGVDDAVALFLAFAAPELELLAVTTVGGNVPGAKTQRNARIMRQIAGREEVPVFGGAERPLKRPPAGAGAFHGAEGLGDLEPLEPTGIVGDGPAAFLTLGIGTIVTALAIWLELAVGPPWWVHVIVWVPLTLGGVVGSLRIAKGWLLALEYRNAAREGQAKR